MLFLRRHDPLFSENSARKYDLPSRSCVKPDHKCEHPSGLGGIGHRASEGQYQDPSLFGASSKSGGKANVLFTVTPAW